MEGDEKFHQRWEFRRKEIDRDSSSDDNRSNASGSLAVNEANDHPESKRHEDNNSKKNQVKKANKRKRNTEAEEVMMFEGLKAFSSSLIQELAVARENMCAQMRDEMRELVARAVPKTEPVVKKKKVQRRKGVVKPKNAKRDSGCKRSKASDEAMKNDHRVLEVARKTETRVPETAHVSSEQVVSASYLTLPTVTSNTRMQSPIKHYLPSNDHTRVMNISNPERHVGRLIDNTKFGSFYHNTAGLFRQSCPQTASVPLTVPLSQLTGNGSSISGLTSLVGRDNMGSSVNGIIRVPIDQKFSYSNMKSKNDGHVCTNNMRNQQ